AYLSSMPEISNFLQVSDRLACAGQPDESQLADIAARGYEVVINLGMADGKYALADEAATVSTLGLAYHHIPVRFDNPQVADWGTFANVMNEHRSQKTFVHCAANYRATAFTGLYLFATSKVSEEALSAFIAQIWQPDPVWQRFIDEVLRRVKEHASRPPIG
ncbi:MAG TPA: protein tyrosine phosphatase family protein, partial [Puia sp.]|nr:protein tyrosine phosphatase family protein [Puia sp.]